MSTHQKPGVGEGTGEAHGKIQLPIPYTAGHEKGDRSHGMGMATAPSAGMHILQPPLFRPQHPKKEQIGQKGTALAICL